MNEALESRQLPEADHATLRGDHGNNESRYTIALKGSVDDRWAEAFRLSQADSPVLQRFRLNRATASIGFTCREVDGAVHVLDMLDTLDRLLKDANERFDFWRNQNPAVTVGRQLRGIA
ncbi:MAG TPA: hypothetical protein VGK26_06615 [Thermoanaerobaculia bacterium]